MHHGGVASAAAAAAYQTYSSLSAQDLGLGQPPSCPAVLTGGRIQLSLHGVVGFSDVILRLIATLDSELACALSAEDEFRARWLLKIGKGHSLISTDSTKRKRQVGRLVGKLGLPRPARTDLAEAFLRKFRLVG